MIVIFERVPTPIVRLYFAVNFQKQHNPYLRLIGDTMTTVWLAHYRPLVAEESSRNQRRVVSKSTETIHSVLTVNSIALEHHTYTNRIELANPDYLSDKHINVTSIIREALIPSCIVLVVVLICVLTLSCAYGLISCFYHRSSPKVFKS